MATLAPLQPLRTREPTLQVDNQLEPGRHRFRLEVVGVSGQRSRADEVVVEVARGRGLPAAEPTAAPANGRSPRAARSRKTGAHGS
jgi:hypothetical protein